MVWISSTKSNHFPLNFLRNAIHRDIKPENILIDTKGVAKLADFNIMKDLEVSMAKTQKGTPYYMAPDVAFGQSYTQNVDVWSLCATFYHAIKGKAPFDNDNISNPIQLLMRKKDSKNYEMVTEDEFNCPALIQVINHNLAIVSKDDDDLRLSVNQILRIFKDKLDMSKLKKGVYSGADCHFW
jgi:serine/threonine protein kinase